LSVVVDASVLVRALAVDSGPDGQWAEAIIEGGALHAPELVYVEVTDILRKFERAQAITTADAIAAHEDLLELNLELFSFEPFGNASGSCGTTSQATTLGTLPSPKGSACRWQRSTNVSQEPQGRFAIF